MKAIRVSNETPMSKRMNTTKLKKKEKLVTKDMKATKVKHLNEHHSVKEYI